MNLNDRAVRVRFVERVGDAAPPWITFADPRPCYAVLSEQTPAAIAAVTDASGDTLDILIRPAPRPPSAADPAGQGEGITISLRGVDVTWRPGRASLYCSADQSEMILRALVDFSFYERELRNIEREIAGAWTDLERDKRLAYRVTPADLTDQEPVALRMNETLDRRIRLSRISPWLYQPARDIPTASQPLVEALRERTDIEDRLEGADGHLEVFEHIYEMASQRIGEFRASHAEQRLEWVIVVLLAAETLLLLLGTLWPARS